MHVGFNTRCITTQTYTHNIKYKTYGEIVMHGKVTFVRQFKEENSHFQSTPKKQETNTIHKYQLIISHFSQCNQGHHTDNRRNSVNK